MMAVDRDTKEIDLRGVKWKSTSFLYTRVEERKKVKGLRK